MAERGGKREREKRRESRLSDDNAEDEHGFALRQDPQLLDCGCQLIRENKGSIQTKAHARA